MTRRDMRGRPLNHRDIGAMFPQARTDIMGRVIRTDDHRLLPTVLFPTRVRSRMVLVALKTLLSRKHRNLRISGDSQGEDQMDRTQDDILPVAFEGHYPSLFFIIP